ncbi:hypothetical protein BKA69DRAFT_408808 [Paraphysoderma sedebokerense]|nr:hypothetical protein BKA69DRAFT_408808 [Paraphysoderma sedebokerense]
MISPEKLSNFLSQLTFSAPVSGFIDFCDGLHVAELIHMYAPLLVPASELGRFKVDSGLVNRGWKRVNWEYLNLSAIEQVLMVLMKQLDLYTRIQRNTHIYTKSYMYDNFELLSSIKTFRGSPLNRRSTIPLPHHCASFRYSHSHSPRKRKDDIHYLR